MQTGIAWFFRGALILIVLVGVAFGFSLLLTDRASSQVRSGRSSASLTKPNVQQPRAAQAERKPWNTRADGTPYLYGDGWFDDSGYFFGVMFTQRPAIRNRSKRSALT